MHSAAETFTENKIQAAAGNLSVQPAQRKPVFQLQDNRPQSVMQKKLADGLANKGVENFSLSGDASAVVQAKQFYEDNPNSGKTAEFYNHQLIVLQLAMKAAVEALPDNATTADAQGAMRAVFGGHAAVRAGHVLNFTGTAVFLDTAAGVHVDRLGTLADDQNADMYLRVLDAGADGNVNSLWVNKSTGEEYVKDANNLFTPRFQSRSITAGDRGNVNGRRAIEGANPNSNATPLQHVGGVESSYISMSAGLEDVTNAHGINFNANNTGRIRADMLQVPSGDIVDLHATQGATAELGRHMAANIRDNFPAIWDTAHARVAAIDAAPAAGKVAAHAAASGARPASMTAAQTLQWQQILDAVRTKEVLVQGALPFDAITSFGDSGAFALGAPATEQIAANAARSQAHSDASAGRLAEHREAAALSPQLTAAASQRKNHSKTVFKAAARAEVFPAAPPAPAGPVGGAVVAAPAGVPAAQRAATFQRYNNAMLATNNHIDTLANLYQQRISGGVYGDGAAGLLAGVAAFIAQANAIINYEVART